MREPELLVQQRTIFRDYRVAQAKRTEAGARALAVRQKEEADALAARGKREIEAKSALDAALAANESSFSKLQRNNLVVIKAANTSVGRFLVPAIISVVLLISVLLLLFNSDPALLHNIYGIPLVGIPLCVFIAWEILRTTTARRALSNLGKHLDEQMARDLLAQKAHTQATKEIADQTAAQIQPTKGRYDQAVKAASDDFHRSLVTLREACAPVNTSATAYSPPWDNPMWQMRRPNFVLTPLTRLGEFQIGSSADMISSPALFPFPGDRPLLMKATGLSKGDAVKAIQAFLLRLLASVPPGKAQFVFVDPVGLGQNVASFMQLGDYSLDLITGKVWNEEQQIQQQLANLTEHTSNVIQKYLRDQFATIEDYNERAGEVAEPYRFLVVLDFPVGFTQDAARRLVSLISNGPRCGVYPVILQDTAQVPPHGFNQDDLDSRTIVIEHKDGRFIWRDENYSDLNLILDKPPDQVTTDRLIGIVGEGTQSAGEVEVPVSKMFALFAEQIRRFPQDYPGFTSPTVLADKATWWATSTADALIAPLGRAGATRVQYLDLGKKAKSSGTEHHVLVAGRVGSGKSMLLYTLINSLTITYGPDELVLYLIDFKEGVGFKPYATYGLPHARVVAIESEREFGLSVIQGLENELKRRGELFRTVGVDHIADYRSATKEKLPRILLIVDEFQVFFVENDQIAAKANQILDGLVRLGRAFGIHVLLCTQTLAGAFSLARSTIGQIAVRIALQCEDKDSRLILAEDNPGARLLTRSGEAIYNATNGLPEGNNLFQVAYLPNEERLAFLERITMLANERHFRPLHPQIVFESKAPADLRKNQPLIDTIESSTWSDPSRPARAWIGEPIAIRDPVAATFRRQGGSNLLIVGRTTTADEDEAGLDVSSGGYESARAIMAMCLISLAAQHPPAGTSARNSARFYLLDFSIADTGSAGFFTTLAQRLPHKVVIGRSRQLPAMIAEIEAAVKERLREVEASEFSDNSTASEAIYLLVYGLQRAGDLRLGDSVGFSAFRREDAVDPAQQFATILHDGPEVGVHSIIWCDSLPNLKRCLDARMMRECALRVIFQMSAEDSAALIGDASASKLGMNRAFYNNEDEGRREKLRPYGLPDSLWMDWMEQHLRAKISR